MSKREAKTSLYEQFARMGKGLASPKRLELLDLLAQGERSVESLATEAGLGLSTASMHLQALKDSGLVTTRRQGTAIHYRLNGDDVRALFAMLRDVATAHLADAERAATTYLGGDPHDFSEAVERAQLLESLSTGEIVVLDVRPTLEFKAGHVPGARSVPLSELDAFISTLKRDLDVVVYCRGAYCVLAYDAVKALNKKGFKARRLQEGMLEWRLAGLPVEKSVA
jgi:rhodanese-related sulfurtransferase/DNA-binding transcriptional ArsR family regulator